MVGYLQLEKLYHISFTVDARHTVIVTTESILFFKTSHCSTNKNINFKKRGRRNTGLKDRYHVTCESRQWRLPLSSLFSAGWMGSIQSLFQIFSGKGGTGSAGLVLSPLFRLHPLLNPISEEQNASCRTFN
ncbi:hypothetical protein CEXT_161101 [Caerostris extrusa]|uniref:Uncharacterized protein n=1 Tax=Caerostris extrusa TaxID=172846 RepID=A0AAV4TII3_CAEEX|nr:hypothetical protein CEXT_161101 [Caerostris extrusa]